MMPRTKFMQCRAARLVASLMAAMLLFASMPLAVDATSSGNGARWGYKVIGAKLPYGAYRSSIAWSGEKAYIMTGRDTDELKGTIIEFDPAKGTTRIMGARMEPRIMSTGTWFGDAATGHAYIFGGQKKGNMTDEILMFDPRDDNVTVLPSRLPEATMGASAVSDGNYIYVIGGRNVTQHTPAVSKFDPATGAVTSIPSMPKAGGGRGAVWTGNSIYLFGNCESGIALSDVHLYDPATGGHPVHVGPVRGFYWTTAAWTGSSALVFAGNNYTRAFDGVWEFVPGDDPLTGTFEQVAKLPQPMDLGVSFYDEAGGAAYYLGGENTTMNGSTAIYEFTKSDAASGGMQMSSRSVTVLGVLAVVTLAVVALNARKTGK